MVWEKNVRVRCPFWTCQMLSLSSKIGPGLISSFPSKRWLRVVLDGTSSQEYPVNAGVPKGSILGPILFLLYINDLPDDVICNIAIYADDTTLYSKCDQASDLWQQLELASELESDLWDTVDWGKKWLVNVNAVKTQLVSFDRSNSTGSIDVKNGWVYSWGKIIFLDAGVDFPSKFDWGIDIILLLLQLLQLLQLHLFYEVSFSGSCSVSLYMYQMPVYGILLSGQGWCP